MCLKAQHWGQITGQSTKQKQQSAHSVRNPKMNRQGVMEEDTQLSLMPGPCDTIKKIELRLSPVIWYQWLCDFLIVSEAGKSWPPSVSS